MAHIEKPSGALLATSIITIIISPGLYFVVAFLIFVVNTGEPGPSETYGLLSDFAGLAVFAAFGMPLIILVLTLFAGILGIASYRRPQRALGCFFVGVELVFFVFAYFILIVLTMGSGTTSFALTFCAVNLIVPVSYTIAAYRFRFKKRPLQAPPGYVPRG